ncbi:hypothetical protein evm_011610 [Chilo suppressalis]|nr:hypothetical protein evm_011610 [Chilo suppressalis]
MTSTRLFVGNLPDTVKETDIEAAFSKYGQIVNVDFKNKSGSDKNQKLFGFVTISASNYEVESCINHFSSEDFYGNRLFVTRARESFLERLQRERHEAQLKEAEKNAPQQDLPKKNPVLKLSEKLNPRKRKFDTSNNFSNQKKPHKQHGFENSSQDLHNDNEQPVEEIVVPEMDKKKQESDKKRMESMKRKRQEFLERQKIIKTGLIGIDKVTNNKVIFSDINNGDTFTSAHKDNNTIIENYKTKSSLFDDDASDDDVNFEIKEQFEGKMGQKVLDLQSRYKSDKRFILDERFIEDGNSEEEKDCTHNDNEDKIDLGDADEKTKQLNILQDVLGVSIKTRTTKPEMNKTKSKLGMLRFDPSQPEHAKFLAPVDKIKQESTKKAKKKKLKEQQEDEKTKKVIPENDKPKIEVSKEQFYKVSETLKESLEQPNNFSLRSLFGPNEYDEKVTLAQDTDYIPLGKPKDPKVKNPLNLVGKNPFIYDSSDSETEEVVEIKSQRKSTETNSEVNNTSEPKAVWKENLFFSKSDSRLQDGLSFFNKTTENEPNKERRVLKSVMKKRLYNKERKNQMFQKKIGGKRKSMKKIYKKKH